MTAFSPDQQFDNVKKEIGSTIKSVFPLKGRRSEVVLHGVDIRDTKSSDDIRSQRDAIRKGRSWTVPVYGDVSLMRNGKEVDRKNVILMHLPKTTDRFGYIVKGNEYQLLNQFRLKSGVYHRVAPNGDALSEFNLENPDQFANGKSFKLRLNPKNALFYLHHRNSNVPLYPLLREMGVSDKVLEKAWGKEILEKNQAGSTREKAMRSFLRAVEGESPKEITKKHTTLLKSMFKKTRLLPETTEKTLGRAYRTVTPDLITRSTGELLALTRGKRKGDDKNSLEFQSVHSAEDLLKGQIQKNLWKIERKIKNNIDKKRSVRGIVPTDTFDRLISSLFSSSLATQGDQTNPLEMLSGARKTTIMGEQGGIKSSYAVSEKAKLINQSHLGFLDPIHTPEGEKTGVSLALPLAVRKKGDTLISTFVDRRTGRVVDLNPTEAGDAVISFADQFDLGKGRPKARHKKVTASKRGKLVVVKPSEVSHIIPSPRGMFGVSSNLIPFLQNNQGNRAMTAARQQEQAVPLESREAPLVQVKTDSGDTFESILGNLSARKSPVAGVVSQVRKDSVVIKDKKGKRHEVQVYKDFPLKGGSLYDSDIKVKAGDQVKRGQLLADTTFTRDGTLALGTNLKTAYVPFFGYNFEDGIVISDDAAKKLTSLHVHKEDIQHDSDTKISRKAYLSQYPHVYKKEQISDLGDDGVVAIGTVVREGDPLVLALRKPTESAQRKMIYAYRRGRPDKWRDRSVRWDKPYPGVVTDVAKKGGRLVVYVKTREPAQVGDKLVGRHGNKGVITRIVPSAEMPYMEDKKGNRSHIDIAMNPLGVPGRINLGQVLETVAGKIAEAKGTPYEVMNFEPGKNYLESMKKELSAAGLTDKESLINPKTGKPFEQDILTGNQYILKLKHQATKKLSARAGTGAEGSGYDINLAPTGGAPHGGQRMGELGLYSLLAHGSRENLREMYAYKSERNQPLWDALREGTPLPMPKAPFAYNKLTGYMQGMRLNVRKEGNQVQLVPLTESQVLGMSAGEIKDPGLVVRGKDLRELKGGIFDPDITGGLEGTRWSHFKLPEAMPNPVFEDAIKKLTGMTGRTYMAVVQGKEEINGKRGGAAIGDLLSKIDVSRDLAAAQTRIKSAKGAGRDKLNKKIRILKALKAANLSPNVYMMESVPVLPPKYRPVTVKDDGSISSDDINGLYKDLGAVIEGYKVSKKAGVPDSLLSDQRAEIYDGLKALTGTGGSLTREYRGIIDLIAGKTRTRGGGSRGASKTGFFQGNLMKRRQDFTGRSIIIPEPKQSIDELGVPEEMAWKLYEPFVQREMTLKGFFPLDAIDEIRGKTPAARAALERVATSHGPIMLKRDPALHKQNVMAFTPRIVKGKALEIHPLVTAGYNADFDGDAMSVYLPITAKAVKEAEGMFPSKNLFSPTTGNVLYTPGHEALLGMYLLSKPGKRTASRFSTGKEAHRAEARGDISKTDIIRVGGHETTVGRLMIEDVLPSSMRETGKKRVKDMTLFDKGHTNRILTDIAKSKAGDYDRIANRFKDIGNDHSTNLGFSIGLQDFSVLDAKGRDTILRDAGVRADKVRGQKNLSEKDKEDKILGIFSAADDKLDKMNDTLLQQNPTNIYQMMASGARGKPDQLKQIVSTPALVRDASNQIVPYLIPKSYSEGMDMASYWTTLHGARKGTIQKTQGVRDPGYLSKLIINSTMDQLVTENDCGTKHGIDMSLDDPDVVDRYLARGTRVKGRRYRAGTLVTPEMVSGLRKSKKGSLDVRSALRCEAPHGVCKKCMGLSETGKPYKVGTNLGVIAGQSLGEPSTQLAMRVFHTGGLAKGKGAKSTGLFSYMKQLLHMPNDIPNEAALALAEGNISRVEKAPQGGEYVHVGDTRHYVPETQKVVVRRGQKVRRGDLLSEGGVINPKKLLPLKGVEAVQDHLSSELHRTIGTVAPVKRRNIEVVVKALTGITQVDQSADHPDWTSGDIVPTAKVHAWNKKRRKSKEKVRHTPLLRGVDVFPKTVGEDWLARLNFQDLNKTITQAAREGWKSDIHGYNPIPALAYGAEFGKGEDKVPEWKGQY